MKYKAGEYVMVRHDLELNKLYGSYALSITMNRNVGKICKILKATGKYYIFTDGIHCYTDEMLTPLTNTDFYEGCYVTDGVDTRRVLGVVGDIYFLSCYKDLADADWFATKKELIDRGFRVDGFVAKEFPVPLTVKEISERLGYDVLVVKGVD